MIASRYTKTGLVFGFKKNKSWLPARQVVQAGSYPRTGKRRGLYSGKTVFGFYPKTILRWVYKQKKFYVPRTKGAEDKKPQRLPRTHKKLLNEVHVYLIGRLQ